MHWRVDHDDKQQRRRHNISLYRYGERVNRECHCVTSFFSYFFFALLLPRYGRSDSRRNDIMWHHHHHHTSTVRMTDDVRPPRRLHDTSVLTSVSARRSGGGGGCCGGGNVDFVCGTFVCFIHIRIRGTCHTGLRISGDQKFRKHDRL